jgi:ribosomal protein S19E (S16A)
MPKANPKNLNSLQLRTLAMFQRLATVAAHIVDTHADGSVTINDLPAPHGDHFHVGSAVVATRDASGLRNEAVWLALQRKGLVQSDFPDGVTLTRAGLDYETGVTGLFIEHHHH